MHSRTCAHSPENFKLRCHHASQGSQRARLPHKQCHTLSGKHCSVKGGQWVWARDMEKKRDSRHRQASGGVGSDKTESKYSNLILTINKYVIKPFGLCYYKIMAVMLRRNQKAQCSEGFPTCQHWRHLIFPYRELHHISRYTFFLVKYNVY